MIVKSLVIALKFEVKRAFEVAKNIYVLFCLNLKSHKRIIRRTSSKYKALNFKTTKRRP